MSDDLRDDQHPSSRADVDADHEDGARETNPIGPPCDAPRPNFNHPVLGKPTAVWSYKDASGELLFYIARYDPPQERKQFIPYTFHSDAAGGEWRRKSWPKPRPLFNRDKLAARPDAPVLVVEGEKAAVGLDGHGGAAALLPSHVCITSAGGAEAAYTADWSPLAGCDVVIWPDADEAGANYAKDVARLAWAAGARSVRIVNVADLPRGFDLGDEIPLDLDIEGRLENAREFGRYISYERFTMDPVTGLSVEIERKDRVETHFVAAPFEVLGRARSPEGEQWARLLRWLDEDGRVHTAPIADADLHGEAKTLAAHLAALGLRVSTGRGRSHLADYLNGLPCERRLTIVERTGWHIIGSQRVFVLPTGSIGSPRTDVLLNCRGATPYEDRDSLEDWQQCIGRLVCGQARLMFAVATAFAGPLLRIVEQEGGGFHFFGDSSIGKTAAAAAAASVWGRGCSPGFMRPWRATANAIEGAAALHNDNLLVLDEIGLVDAREAAPAAYQLAGGAGKGRLARDGSLRSPLTWRTIVLSTGEIRLADKLREYSRRPMAGQSVRLLDIPADVGRGFGIFDHPGETGRAKELADQIKLAACTHYGSAGPGFVEAVLKCAPNEIEETIRAAITKFQEDIVPDRADGQVQRAADRFALVGVAGELASDFGIVSWPRGQAYQAAAGCFEAWLDQRGGMEPAEIQQAISQVRRYIEAHGQSRFEELEAQALLARPIVDRAGFRQGSGDFEQWWVLPETWKDEVCGGLDPTRTARVLADRGMLIPGDDGFTSVRRVSRRPMRVYVLTSKILAGEADE